MAKQMELMDRVITGIKRGAIFAGFILVAGVGLSFIGVQPGVALNLSGLEGVGLTLITVGLAGFLQTFA